MMPGINPTDSSVDRQIVPPINQAGQLRYPVVATHAIDIFAWNEAEQAWDVMQRLKDRISQLESVLTTIVKIGGSSVLPTIDTIRVFSMEMLEDFRLTKTQRSVLMELCDGTATMISAPPWRLWRRNGRAWRNLHQTTVDALMPFLTRNPLGDYLPNEVAAAWFKMQKGDVR